MLSSNTMKYLLNLTMTEKLKEMWAALKLERIVFLRQSRKQEEEENLGKGGATTFLKSVLFQTAKSWWGTQLKFPAFLHKNVSKKYSAAGLQRFLFIRLVWRSIHDYPERLQLPWKSLYIQIDLIFILILQQDDVIHAQPGIMTEICYRASHKEICCFRWNDSSVPFKVIKLWCGVSETWLE